MRIEAYNQVQQLFQAKQTAKQEKVAKGGFSDKLQISNLGKDLQVGKQAVRNASDIRKELVDPIKKAVQNGTYSVTPESFAAKLMEKYDEMR
ncbi:MAG: flagellar biosynthesis anti-sigma factor FlgM [Lachnospiraceae bacterium]|jgi:negative regulator of flagellin synthesis FlgM|nr:flagellar biosynthesis anti-sigma factor FlgM [Lachnospiraceae bacterium]